VRLPIPPLRRARHATGDRNAPVIGALASSKCFGSRWKSTAHDFGVEATGGFEPPNKGFADLSLNHLGTSPESRADSIAAPGPGRRRDDGAPLARTVGVVADQARDDALDRDVARVEGERLHGRVRGLQTDALPFRVI